MMHGGYLKWHEMVFNLTPRLSTETVKLDKKFYVLMYGCCFHTALTVKTNAFNVTHSQDGESWEVWKNQNFGIMFHTWFKRRRSTPSSISWHALFVAVSHNGSESTRNEKSQEKPPLVLSE